MKPVSVEDVNRLVLRKQHLSDDSRAERLVEMVWDIGGLHATSAIGPYISAFLRCKDFRREDLDRELYVNKSLGQLRCMRFTMYIQPTGAFAMYHSAMKRTFETGYLSRLKRVAMPEKEYERLERSILALLRDGGKTAAEIKKALGVDTSLFQVLNAMCDTGLLAKGMPKGSWKSNLHTYHLFGDYYPDVDLEMEEKLATASLALHYLKAFGPATEADIAWWTGLRRSDIREAIESLEARTDRIDVSGLGNDMIVDYVDIRSIQGARAPKKPAVRLLPSLDPYLMGYKDRDRYLDKKHYGCVYDRSGNATTCIMVDGRIAGVWDIDEKAIGVYLFEEAPESVLREIRRQAEEMSVFLLGKPLPIKECSSMVPLSDRPPGAVMTPLKGQI
ncbi:conserved hypothetical protein [Methanocella paludicola SANAE]|uniref:Winged helix DNA-binding domain-containing protein n=1 Tax=Methanocella paludicola (strain DSM 17711 / JCM 13418 / NBRC 101707 / SANAE) TaxID=304371 RepID=D1YVI9_METPS|nr:winged helix DNA-binding domain-containing protein [Methanocella paludicola]BAI60461.1 conserved hypothetical protein [Methanocella paludicola SANAE]